MNNIARIKQKGKNFEIIVDTDKAIEFKREGKGDIRNILEIDTIFSDSKKGFKASEEDLKTAFGLTDVYEIAEKIIKNGEVLLPQEYRDEEREKRIKQIIAFLEKNATNPKTRTPYTSETIKSAIEQAHINITNRPIEEQMSEILQKLNPILPIKIETKKIKITIPAIYTGKVYGVINQYKEKEDWKANGDLEVIVSVPSGLIMSFYDKLNLITHGSAITEEIQEGMQ